ncbi:hypothetical protein H6G00_00785 [Leptolyngbya sp. FACHB-541]|uniref:hypothetical protein n=1 Tax=Leptolyngbya sp. FACHB-541 TaxID=2692810 RepID=UPI001688C19B|nr:hypothetical protein [Leptolyngbya sp. FACHB-541]MBD1995163.1 hypothetical protein [Leptolyngbya sp. FACHB-541]
MIPANLNLFIPQGADCSLTITVLQGEPMKAATDVAADSLSIPLVKPITAALPLGTRLMFGEAIAELSAPAPIGTKALPITGLLLPISRNAIGQIVADLTGCSARSQIKRKPGTPAIAIFTPWFDPDPLTGLFSLSLTNQQTSALPANLPPGTSLTEEELQERRPQPTDYFWDVELVYPNAKVERPMNGLVLVSAEVTTPLIPPEPEEAIAP